MGAYSAMALVKTKKSEGPSHRLLEGEPAELAGGFCKGWVSFVFCALLPGVSTGVERVLLLTSCVTWGSY